MKRVCVVDVFCGCGGLSYGLKRAGLDIIAGIDNDPDVDHAYATNVGRFIRADVTDLAPEQIAGMYPEGCVRVLAGCAPCQPFSNLNRKKDHPAKNMLAVFADIVRGVLPDIVVSENVPQLATRGGHVFGLLLRALDQSGYHYDHGVLNAADYGVPQNRRRLILLASRIGAVTLPQSAKSGLPRTVRETIGHLPAVRAGESSPNDPLHSAAKISDLGMRRMQSCRHDGGYVEYALLPRCHRERRNWRKYRVMYSRMEWDSPAPTITTQFSTIGCGRFGHPVQDRAITLREGALLQSFPEDYDFWPQGDLKRTAIARMIGNAVPPKLAEAIGVAIMDHVTGWYGI